MDAIAELPKRTHGCPADRGSADAYYGRGYAPHYYAGGVRVTSASMTPEQIALYRAGYEGETERKQWD